MTERMYVHICTRGARPGPPREPAAAKPAPEPRVRRAPRPHQEPPALRPQHCAVCGRPSMPLFPCCERVTTTPRAPDTSPARVDEAKRQPAEEGRFVAYEIVRPAAGLWGDAGGLSSRSDCAGIAHSMLMYSSAMVATEHLPVLERIIELEDGKRVNRPARIEDLVGVAVAADREEHRSRFPGRLERLQAAGRLPRIG